MQHCRPSLQASSGRKPRSAYLEARSAWALSVLPMQKKRWDQDKHPQSQGSLARMLRNAAETWSLAFRLAEPASSEPAAAHQALKKLELDATEG